jgi:hypothetical protein
MIDFIKEYWGGITNSLLFVLVIILFFLRFTLKQPHPKLPTAYTALTMIFAVWSVATIAYKYITSPAGNKEISLTYLVAFLINAVLGMTTLYAMQHIKLLEALLILFFVVIIFVLFNLNSVKTAVDSSGADILDSGSSFFSSPLLDIFKVQSWDDWKTKSGNFFNWILAWDDDSFLSNLLWLIIGIIKLPFFVLLNCVWFLTLIMRAMSLLFGKITPPAPATPPVAGTPVAKGFFEGLSDNLNKSITYGILLVLFMAFIFVMYVSQTAMRKNPIGALMVVAAIAITVLSYVRFFKNELFEKTFLSSLVGLFMFGVYLYNPYNILHLITGVNMFAIFIICFFLLGMIMIYNIFPESKPATATATAGTPAVPKYASGIAGKFSSYFGKIIMGLAGLIVSITLIMFLVASIGQIQDKSPTIGMYVLNTLIIVGMLTIAFNTLDSSRTVRDNPFFKLAISLILYIPCLLSDLADLVMSEYYKTKYFTLIIIVLEVLFIIAYWFLYPEVVSKAYSGGGQVLVNDPISLNTIRTVGHYSKLSGSSFLDYSDKQTTAVQGHGAFDDGIVKNAVSGEPMLDLSGNPIKDMSGNYYFPTRVNTYRYAISFWVYINPMPSAGSSQLSILNYGSNPNVMYNPKTNEFSVFMQSTTSDCTAPVDASEIVPVYTHLTVPLQSWFNVVLNYDGGRLDVFLNAELVKTSFDVISCIRYDALTVGDTTGLLNAKMCNLTYFNAPLDIITIHTMFNITKIEDIPSVPKKDLFSI